MAEKNKSQGKNTRTESATEIAKLLWAIGVMTKHLAGRVMKLNDKGQGGGENNARTTKVAQ